MKKKVSLLLTVIFVMTIATFGYCSNAYADPYATTYEIQQRLQAAGYNVGTIDGILGAKTEAAIRAFQADSGLLADGIVGPMTQTALWKIPVASSNQQTASATTTTATTTAGTSVSANTSTTTTTVTAMSTTSSYDVADIQQKLQAAGFNVGVVDGILGTKTMAAIIDFQAANGLKADGIVGPATLAALGVRSTASASQTTAASQQTTTAANTNTTSSTTVNDIAAIQQRLQAAGYNVGTVDGILGAKTENAIMEFQADHGLRIDGIVGPATQAALGI